MAGKQMKVRSRMLWIFLPAVLIPLLVFGMLMLYSSYFELERSSTQTYTQMTAQIGAVFSEYVSRVDQTNRTVEKLENIPLFLRMDATELEKNADTRFLLEQKAKNDIAQLAHTNDGLYALTVSTLDDEQLSYVQEKHDRSMLSVFDSYYEPLLASTGQTVILPVRNSQYRFSPEEPVFVVACKYMDIPDGINIYTGYVIAECPVSRLAQICSNVEMGQGSKLCILDQNGQLAYCDSGTQIGETIADLLAQGRSQGRVTIQDEDYLLVSTYLPDTGWTMAAAIPYAQVTEQTAELMTTFLVLCLVCGLIMVTVIIVQSGSFTKPILGLQKAMKKVSGGDMTVRVTHNRKDEFGELSEGFNRLVGELDQLITHVAESNQRENLAKYQMLQSQINPHFLYNTLDTIRMMAVLQDQDDISEALICLSNLFRYCIRQGDRLVTVREELQQVKNYLMLQKLRHQDRLQVIYQVDEQVLNRTMPKVLLQPLLENAFAHGLQDREETGVITISAQQVAEGTRLAVHDNGVGIDSTALQKIRSSLSDGTSESIGLANVNDRLRLYYKNAKGLVIDSIPGEGTTVAFTVPLEEQPSALLNYEQRTENSRKEETK